MKLTTYAGAGKMRRAATTLSFLASSCALSVLMLSSSLQAADEYYRTDGTTSTWTSSVWSTTGSSPFTSAWVSGSNAIFSGTTSSITGATTTVANITANGNVTVNTGGNMLFSSTTLNVADTKTFLLGASSGSAIGLDSASSITKTGLGTLTLFESTAYTGGFTESAGIVNWGNNNALGVGALTFNGGTIQSNAATARSQTFTSMTIGGNFTLGGSGALTFTSPTIALGGAVREVTTNNSATSEFSGVISGTSGNGFSKLGDGQLNFTGATANTYSGLTMVSAGTLGLGKTAASINAFGGNLTINGGAVIYSSTSNEQIPDAAKVTISSGSLALGARTETIGATATATSGLAVSGTGAITISSGTLTVANSASMTGGNISLTGSGTLQTNVDLAFSGGTINLGSNTSAVLNLRGGTGTGITYSSSGTSAALITGSGGTLSLNTAASATTVFDIADASTVATELTVAVPITGAGKNIQKISGGVLALTGANTYTGTTAINGGTLNAGVAQNGTTSGPMGTNGSITFGGGTLQYSAANQFDYSARFSTAAGQAYSVDTNGQNVTFATALSSNGGTLAKSGNGTLTLSNANTYSGKTTVSGGTLEIANNGTTTGRITGSGAADSIQVSPGGTLLLSGAGNQDRLNNAAGITLAGGTFSRGGGASEGTGASTTDGGATRTGSTAVGLGPLALTVNSTMDFGNGAVGTLTFADFTPTSGTTLNILNFVTTASGYDLTTSGVDGTTDRLIFLTDQSNNLGFFSFNGAGASQIVLGDGFEIVPVPEPATLLGGLLLLGVLGWNQRRRLGELAGLRRNVHAA